MNDDRILLLRYLEGSLPEAEHRAVQKRLAEDASLREQLNRLNALGDALAASAPDSFAPFFSERVVRRLSPALELAPAEAFYDSLQWFFVRMTLACLLIVAALGVYNLMTYEALGVTGTLAEAVFGLPSTDLIDALYSL